MDKPQWGDALIFSYIRRFGSFFFFFFFFFFLGGGGVKILNFKIVLGFQKNKYFWGYEDFVGNFWVITKLDYI